MYALDEKSKNDMPILLPKAYEEISYKLLIPQKSSTRIRDARMKEGVLSITSFVIDHLVEALKAFYINKMYSNFDPHVGETSCQVRSYIVYIFAEQFGNYSNELILKRIADLKNIHMNLCENISEGYKRQHRNNSLTVEKYLNMVGGEFFISEFEFFLVSSYLLTKYKRENQRWHDFIDCKQMAVDAGVSHKMAHRLIKFYQRRLASISCDYILSWSDDIKQGVFSVYDLDKYILFDDNNRRVFPTYLSTKIIIKHMAPDVPLVLIVYSFSAGKECVSAFRFEGFSQRGVELVPDECQQSDLPVITIVSESKLDLSSGEVKESFLDDIFRYGLERCILANTASHPQYPGYMLDQPLGADKGGLQDVVELNELVAEIEGMALWAAQKGCCWSNKGIFRIRHIYCDTLMHLLDGVLSDSMALTLLSS